MTITMTEAKIQRATAYLYEKVQLSTDLTVEDCEQLVRGMQELWQDTEEVVMGADGDWIKRSDPTPASEAPPGGDLYGAIWPAFKSGAT